MNKAFLMGVVLAIGMVSGGTSEEATLVPVKTGREKVEFQPKSTFYLGTGFATRCFVKKNILAVASEKRAAGKPVDDAGIGESDVKDPPEQWVTSHSADIYRLATNGTCALWAAIPATYKIRALAHDGINRFIVADELYVSCYSVAPKGEVRLEWRHFFPKVDQLVYQDRIVWLRSKSELNVLADGNGAFELKHRLLFSSRYLSLHDHQGLLITSGRGEATVFNSSPVTAMKNVRALTFLGDVRFTQALGPQVLVLDRDYGLRIADIGAYLRDSRHAALPTSLEDDKVFIGTFDAKRTIVKDGLPLKEDIKDWVVLKNSVVLLKSDGMVETVPVDSTAFKFGAKASLQGLKDIVGVQGDDERLAAVDTKGAVYLWTSAEPPVKAIEPVETGPWMLANGRLLVAAGNVLHHIVDGKLGSEAYRAGGLIKDIAPAGDLAYILTAGHLEAVKIEGDNLAKLGALKVPADSRFFRAGPEYGVVAYGERGLMAVDLRNPKSLRKAADHELDLPTHSEVPTKLRDNELYKPIIRDALVESNRVFVVGTECFIYDMAKMLSSSRAIQPARMFHRPYISVDDIGYIHHIAQIGHNLYFLSNARFHSVRRAYVVNVKDDGTFDWSYSRLGGGFAADVFPLGQDVFLMAEMDRGLRALRIKGVNDTALLGTVREPICDYRAVLADKDTVYVKDGNRIRVLGWKIAPVVEPTAYTFKPMDTSALKVLDNGMDICSQDYQEKRGYRNPLKLVETDLSDKAGWPNIEVKQGAVAVNAKQGRLKFADGREGDPRMLARVESANVGVYLSNWKVGDYYIAAGDEQSKGLKVVDLRDPTCLKIVAAAGQAPWCSYAGYVIAYRNGYAYLTCNVFNTLVVVDLRDLAQIHYERMINMADDRVLAGRNRSYSGFFRDDRLFVPCTKGTVEVDVSNPEYVRRVALHEAAHHICQVIPEKNLALRLLPDRVEMLDISNIAQPVVRGRYPAEGALPFTVSNVQLVDDRIYLLGAEAKAGNKKSVLAIVAASDPAHLQLLSTLELEGAWNKLCAAERKIYLTSEHYEFCIVDARNEKTPVVAGHLEKKDFLGTYHHQNMEKTPRKYVMDGGNYGGVEVVLVDGNIVWLNGTYAVNVADISKPRVVGGARTGGEVWGIRSDDRELATLHEYTRRLIDIGNPREPKMLWEYYRGHPFEIGWPCTGGLGEYQIPYSQGGGIRKWDFEVKDHPAFIQPALYQIWFGPDPEANFHGKPLILLEGRNTVESSPIQVKPEEKLVFRALTQTAPNPYQEPFYRDKYFDYEHPSQLSLEIVNKQTGRRIGSIRNEFNDATPHLQEASFVVPKDVAEVIVRIRTYGGRGWFRDIALLRGDQNLVKNGSFEAPPGPDGIPPEWLLADVNPLPQRTAHADGEALYIPTQEYLYIYDLKSPSKLPCAKIKTQVFHVGDGGRTLVTRKENGRKLAYVVTHQGLVTLDVTNPRAPAKLGAIMLPWGKTTGHSICVRGSLAFIVPGYCSDDLTEGLYIVDIANPARPRFRNFIRDRSSGVTAHNGYVIAGDYNSGYQVYDVTNPDAPVIVQELGYDRCSQTWGIEFHGNHVLRPEVGGLEIWESPTLSQAPLGKVTVP